MRESNATTQPILALWGYSVQRVHMHYWVAAVWCMFVGGHRYDGAKMTQQARSLYSYLSSLAFGKTEIR